MVFREAVLGFADCRLVFEQGIQRTLPRQCSWYKFCDFDLPDEAESS